MEATLSWRGSTGQPSRQATGRVSSPVSRATEGAATAAAAAGTSARCRPSASRTPSLTSSGGATTRTRGRREHGHQLRRLVVQGLPHEVGGHRRRRQRRPQQPVLAHGKTIADGAHGIGDDGHHAADGDVGAILLHRLGGAYPVPRRTARWGL